jgi:hypothetical protein
MLTLTLEEENLILERRREAEKENLLKILDVGFLKYPMYRIKDDSRFEWGVNCILYQEKEMKEFIENCKNRFYIAIPAESVFTKVLSYDCEEIWFPSSGEESGRTEFDNEWAKENLEFLSAEDVKFLTESELFTESEFPEVASKKELLEFISKNRKG